MSKKLTAVQWMNQKMLNFNKSDASWSEIYNQALFMEKEQIMRANIDGYEEAQNYGETSAEEYYNQTYES
jgi:hypothetical protein